MRASATLAEWREAGNLSQKEVADRLSALLGRAVSQPSVCQWESGGVMPGADVAEACRIMSGGMVTAASFGARRCRRA